MLEQLPGKEHATLLRRPDGWFARWSDTMDRNGSVIGPYYRELLDVEPLAPVSKARRALDRWKEANGDK